MGSQASFLPVCLNDLSDAVFIICLCNHADLLGDVFINCIYCVVTLLDLFGGVLIRWSSLLGNYLICLVAYSTVNADVVTLLNLPILILLMAYSAVNAM